MLAQMLMLLSAATLLLLGTAHLIYTFSGDKLKPRDRDLQHAMMQDHPRITRQTTMWRAWVGFNASHSMGAMLFGLIYGFLAIAQPTLLFSSIYLLSVGLAMLIGLQVLAIGYWFKIPRNGISIALACYATSVLLRML